MPVFTANVPRLLKVGDKIDIGGKIKENSRKMSVNLCAQEGEEPRDVVLHFDVRFHRDNIISLSRKNGVWIGSGNYDTNYNMFVPGTIFRIVFEIKDTDVITIYCQGKFHSNFLPKIPLSMARFIVAWGDVERVTHCYFHLGKTPGEEPNPTPSVPIPRQTLPTVAGDTKKWTPSNVFYGPESNIVYQAYRTDPRHRTSTRMPKKASRSNPGSPQPQVARSSNESSDEDFKGRPKDNRTDRFFYETLMCPAPGAGGPPDRHRVMDSVRRCTDYNRKYHRVVTDSEKNESEVYSEDVSKTESTVGESEDILPELKHHRRKISPIPQIVSFMDKNSKRN